MGDDSGVFDPMFDTDTAADIIDSSVVSAHYCGTAAKEIGRMSSDGEYPVELPGYRTASGFI